MVNQREKKIRRRTLQLMSRQIAANGKDFSWLWDNFHDRELSEKTRNICMLALIELLNFVGTKAGIFDGEMQKLYAEAREEMQERLTGPSGPGLFKTV